MTRHITFSDNRKKYEDDHQSEHSFSTRCILYVVNHIYNASLRSKFQRLTFFLTLSLWCFTISWVIEISYFWLNLSPTPIRQEMSEPKEIMNKVDTQPPPTHTDGNTGSIDAGIFFGKVDSTIDSLRMIFAVSLSGILISSVSSSVLHIFTHPGSIMHRILNESENPYSNLGRYYHIGHPKRNGTVSKNGLLTFPGIDTPVQRVVIMIAIGLAIFLATLLVLNISMLWPGQIGNRRFELVIQSCVTVLLLMSTIYLHSSVNPLRVIHGYKARKEKSVKTGSLKENQTSLQQRLLGSTQSRGANEKSAMSIDPDIHANRGQPQEGVIQRIMMYSTSKILRKSPDPNQWSYRRVSALLLGLTGLISIIASATEYDSSFATGDTGSLDMCHIGFVTCQSVVTFFHMAASVCLCISAITQISQAYKEGCWLDEYLLMNDMCVEGLLSGDFDGSFEPGIEKGYHGKNTFSSPCSVQGSIYPTTMISDTVIENSRRTSPGPVNASSSLALRDLRHSQLIATVASEFTPTLRKRTNDSSTERTPPWRPDEGKPVSQPGKPGSTSHTEGKHSWNPLQNVQHIRNLDLVDLDEVCKESLYLLLRESSWEKNPPTDSDPPNLTTYFHHTLPILRMRYILSCEPIELDKSNNDNSFHFDTEMVKLRSSPLNYGSILQGQAFRHLMGTRRGWSRDGFLNSDYSAGLDDKHTRNSSSSNIQDHRYLDRQSTGNIETPIVNVVMENAGTDECKVFYERRPPDPPLPVTESTFASIKRIIPLSQLDDIMTRLEMGSSLDESETREFPSFTSGEIPISDKTRISSDRSREHAYSHDDAVLIVDWSVDHGELTLDRNGIPIDVFKAHLVRRSSSVCLLSMLHPSVEIAKNVVSGFESQNNLTKLSEYSIRLHGSLYNSSTPTPPGPIFEQGAWLYNSTDEAGEPMSVGSRPGNIEPSSKMIAASHRRSCVVIDTVVFLSAPIPRFLIDEELLKSHRIFYNLELFLRNESLMKTHLIYFEYRIWQSVHESCRITPPMALVLIKTSPVYREMIAKFTGIRAFIPDVTSPLVTSKPTYRRQRNLNTRNTMGLEQNEYDENDSGAGSNKDIASLQKIILLNSNEITKVEIEHPLEKLSRLASRLRHPERHDNEVISLSRDFISNDSGIWGTPENLKGTSPVRLYRRKIEGENVPAFRLATTIDKIDPLTLLRLWSSSEFRHEYLDVPYSRIDSLKSRKVLTANGDVGILGDVESPNAVNLSDQNGSRPLLVHGGAESSRKITQKKKNRKSVFGLSRKSEGGDYIDQDITGSVVFHAERGYHSPTLSIASSVHNRESEVLPIFGAQHLTEVYRTHTAMRRRCSKFILLTSQINSTKLIAIEFTVPYGENNTRLSTVNNSAPEIGGSVDTSPLCAVNMKNDIIDNSFDHQSAFSSFVGVSTTSLDRLKMGEPQTNDEIPKAGLHRKPVIVPRFRVAIFEPSGDNGTKMTVAGVVSSTGKVNSFVSKLMEYEVSHFAEKVKGIQKLFSTGPEQKSSDLIKTCRERILLHVWLSVVHTLSPLETEVLDAYSSCYPKIIIEKDNLRRLYSKYELEYDT